MATTEFRIVESGITELFNSPQGDVHRHMVGVAERVVIVAKHNVGTKTGRTRASIHYRMFNVPGGVLVEVSAASKAALFQHRGTRPHAIVAHPGRPLRFRSGGRVVFAQDVLHPGTRPNQYLVTALREVIK